MNDSWDTIRRFVYKRDECICFICKHYTINPNCGHITDRLSGGLDTYDNLVCKCQFCNTVIKPQHKTKEEFFEWCAIEWIGNNMSSYIKECFSDREQIIASYFPKCIERIPRWLSGNPNDVVMKYYKMVTDEYDKRMSGNG